jgi:hypothetical protein
MCTPRGLNLLPPQFLILGRPGSLGYMNTVFNLSGPLISISLIKDYATFSFTVERILEVLRVYDHN